MRAHGSEPEFVAVRGNEGRKAPPAILIDAEQIGGAEHGVVAVG